METSSENMLDKHSAISIHFCRWLSMLNILKHEQTTSPWCRSRTYVQNAVAVDLKGHFNLWLTTGSRRNPAKPWLPWERLGENPVFVGLRWLTLW